MQKKMSEFVGSLSVRIKSVIVDLDRSIHTKRLGILLSVTTLFTVAFALLFPYMFREFMRIMGISAVLSMMATAILVELWIRFGKQSLIRVMTDQRLYYMLIAAICLIGIIASIALFLFGQSILPTYAVLRIMGQSFLETLALAVVVLVVWRIIDKND